MRRIRIRSNFVFLFAVLFIIGISIFTFNLLSNAETWANMPYNGHFEDTNLANAGKITDRYDNVLAYSTDGERLYSENESVRKALLHLIGDNSTNISTAIQSTFRSKISGYSYLFGLSAPDNLSFTKDMQLTIDSNACATAYNALAGRNGAVIVYNYETGEILCSVSAPTYDPSNPPEITSDTTEYEGVYLDRTISSTYTPGSIYKIVTLNAAIENIPNVTSRTFHCDGSTDIDGHTVNCMDTHGDISLKEAFAYSCNIVFAQLSLELGPEVMEKYSNQLGITKSYTIDGNPTAKGNYNVKNATSVELAWSGIGQYTNEVCPMNMAILAGAIARGGTAITPYSVKNNSILDLSLLSDIGNTLISSTSATTIGDMMRYTVSDYYGDGYFQYLTVCAKTGTAEVGSDVEPHGWIMGYTLNKDYPLAFACVVEHGGLGFYSAGQVIAQTLESIVINQESAQ